MSDYAVTIVVPWDGRNPDLLEEAYKTFPQDVPYLVAGNAGKHEMADALNQAIAQVETPFLFVMGADDRLEPDTIQQLIAAVGTADGAYPSLVRFGKETGEFYADLWSPWRIQDWNMVPGAALYRVSSLRAVGGFRSCIYEDWDLHWRMAKAGQRMVPVPAAKYRYRITGQSLSDRIVKASRETGVGIAEVTADIIGDTRVQPLATFYAQGHLVQGYQRCQVPANALPGIARRSFDKSNRHETPATIWSFPGKHDEPLIRHAREELGQAIIVEVDDDYISPAFDRIVRSWGKTDLADRWSVDRPYHRRICKQADAIVCSTLELAEKYASLNDNVHVCPNAIEPADWPTPSRLPDDKIRVGWAGGKQHRPDIPLVKPALEWASKQPGVEVVCIGIDPQFDFPYRYVEFTPSTQVYRDSLSVLDIGLAPIQRKGALNVGKSDLKFLEYAMAGALPILSDVPAYNGTAVHGHTALLAQGASGFRRALAQALAEPETTWRITQNAQHYVMEHRTAAVISGAYKACLMTVGALAPAPQAVAA